MRLREIWVRVRGTKVAHYVGRGGLACGLAARVADVGPPGNIPCCPKCLHRVRLGRHLRRVMRQVRVPFVALYEAPLNERGLLTWHAIPWGAEERYPGEREVYVGYIRPRYRPRA